MATLGHVKVHICGKCASVVSPHEHYHLYNKDGLLDIFSGCAKCLQTYVANMAVVVTNTDTALCPICGRERHVEEFFALRADGFKTPLMNACYGCVSARIANFGQSKFGASGTTKYCAYCNDLVPDYAILRIEASNHHNITSFALNSPIYTGCWLCFINILSSTHVYTLSPSVAPHCEDCGAYLATMPPSGMGRNVFWNCGSGYLATLCDPCLNKRVVNTPMKNSTPKQSAAMAAAATAVAKAVSHPQQHISANQLYSFISKGNGSGNVASFTFEDEDAGKPSRISANDRTLELLRIAARYVQVCLEGGDWDIIDASIDTSQSLLKGIRSHLGLPDDHDFTKREGIKQ